MRTVHFYADRLRLEGSLFLPDERPAGGAPAVVFCHGFGARDRVDVAHRVSRLLVVAAGRDTLMPREDAGNLHAAAREPKRLVTLPDATHHDIYRGHHFDEVADTAARWLAAHLGTTQAEDT